MINRLSIYYLMSAALIMIFSSCSNTKFLADSQLLYTGRSTVVISDSGKFRDRDAFSKIESVTAYQPNNAIGNIRMLPPVGLWIYNYMRPEENKKPGWLYKTFSKEPVLTSVIEPDIRSKKLESELFGVGYFHSTVWFAVDTSKRNPRKAKIKYFIEPGIPFRYDEISFMNPDNEVDSLIYSTKYDLQLKRDDKFNIEILQSEGKRITSKVQEKGYFYFNPDNLSWTADTNKIPNKIDLRIGRKEVMTENSDRKFTIRNIYVNITGDTDSLMIKQTEDTTFFDGIKIISKGELIKPEVISRSIYFRTGDIYAATKHQQTLKHLNSYGVFKFINLQFIPLPDSAITQMDMLLDLTLMKSISLDLETNIVTKSTGFAGPGLEAKLANGNVKKAANRLQLKLNGGFEWQISNKSKSSLGTTSYNLGSSLSLIFPLMLKPPGMFNQRSFTLAQTSITAGFEFLNKIQYYRMSSSNIGFGYQWKKSDKITHILYPLFFNSVTLLRTTPEFDSILNDNPYIRKSFEEQFIAGMKYNFIYDNNLKRQPLGYYFQGEISSSGNLIDLFNRISGSDMERPYSIAGVVYSQFMKLSTDFRLYRNFQDKSLVFRLYSGLGLPYGNSVVMPYVEQFYSGGSNSIRAFTARSVGPGGLKPDETSDIIDQAGDIKLEGNVEYRFKITKVLHGALFVDAGNIWLLNPDENRPGAEFRFSNFTDQLYVGTGIGLRFDFNFFILRTDFGFPLRTGYPLNDSNWVIKYRDVVGGTVFNLAIGYPF